MLKIKKCHYCGRTIIPRSLVKHTNICRDPPVYEFCSREHKIDWMISKEKNKKFLTKFFIGQQKRFPKEN